MKLYTKKILTRNAEANQDHRGVELGKLCMLHGFKVSEVAEVLCVSRATVYTWFDGRRKPVTHLRPKILKLVETLKNKPQPDAA